VAMWAYTEMQIYQGLSKTNSVTLSECIDNNAKLDNQLFFHQVLLFSNESY